MKALTIEDWKRLGAETVEGPLMLPGDDRLIMPTEELVGEALDVLRVAMKGGLVKEQAVTAAVAVLEAYARLRPLQKSITRVS